MDFEELAKDPYNLPEETRIANQLANYEKQAHAGALFEDLRRHPAWQKVEEYMRNFMEEQNRLVFGDPDGDHRKVIFQVQGMIKLRNWIYAQSLAGQIASKGIADHFKAVAEEKKALGLE
jgi:hypothetical protein